MTDANMKSAGATGQPVPSSGMQMGSVEAAKAPQSSTASTARPCPPQWGELYSANVSVMRSAEMYSPGVTHRVTNADFHAIVAAAIATFGHSSPLRVRCGVPPSVLETLSSTSANLAHAAANISALARPASSVSGKTGQRTAPKAGKAKAAVGGGSKPKTGGRKTPGSDKSKVTPPPSGESRPEVDPLQRARLRLRQKAHRALATKDESLQRAYAAAEITKELVDSTIDGMSLEQINQRPPGVPVLSALGLTSLDRLNKYLGWAEEEAFERLYQADLAAVSAASRSLVSFPIGEVQLTTLGKDDVPFPDATSAAEMLRKEFLRPRVLPEVPVLLPELQGGPADELRINISAPQQDTGAHLLRISRKDVPRRQRTYAQVVAVDKGSAAGTLRVLLHSEKDQLKGKAVAALFSATRKNTSKQGEKPVKGGKPKADSQPKVAKPSAPGGRGSSGRDNGPRPQPQGGGRGGRGGGSVRGRGAPRGSTSRGGPTPRRRNGLSP